MATYRSLDPVENVIATRGQLTTCCDNPFAGCHFSEPSVEPIFPTGAVIGESAIVDPGRSPFASGVSAISEADSMQVEWNDKDKGKRDGDCQSGYS